MYLSKSSKQEEPDTTNHNLIMACCENLAMVTKICDFVCYLQKICLIKSNLHHSKHSETVTASIIGLEGMFRMEPRLSSAQCSVSTVLET